MEAVAAFFKHIHTEFFREVAGNGDVFIGVTSLASGIRIRTLEELGVCPCVVYRQDSYLCAASYLEIKSSAA